MISSKGQKYRMVKSWTGNHEIGFTLTLTCGHERGSPGVVRHLRKPEAPKQVRCRQCERLSLPPGTRYTKGSENRKGRVEACDVSGDARGGLHGSLDKIVPDAGFNRVPGVSRPGIAGGHAVKENG